MNWKCSNSYLSSHQWQLYWSATISLLNISQRHTSIANAKGRKTTWNRKYWMHRQAKISSWLFLPCPRPMRIGNWCRGQCRRPIFAPNPTSVSALALIQIRQRQRSLLRGMLIVFDEDGGEKEDKENWTKIARDRRFRWKIENSSKVFDRIFFGLNCWLVRVIQLTLRCRYALYMSESVHNIDEDTNHFIASSITMNVCAFVRTQQRFSSTFKDPKKRPFVGFI